TLGLDTLQALLRDGESFCEFEPNGINPLSVGAVWRHSVTTGMLARRIAVEEGHEATNEAFLAGMLHDIGILVFAHRAPAECNRAWKLRRTGKVDLECVELEVFGAKHSQIGAYLLGLWGLDPSIVDAVAWHHRPGESSTTSFAPLTAVHVADALTCWD